MYANGTAFRVLTRNFQVPAGASTLEVSVTDHANSYVILDAVMVRVVSTASSPLAVSGAAPQPGESEPVVGEQVTPLVTEAITRWSPAGLDHEKTEGLRSAEVKIADLPDATPGLASADTIWIDVDAAGYGWFVDRTPAADREFAPVGVDAQLEVLQGDASERIDLLTVLAHELGHLAGREDLDPATHAHDLMAATLGIGIRRMPVSQSDSTRLASPVRLHAGLPAPSLAVPVTLAPLETHPEAKEPSLIQRRRRNARDAFFAGLDDTFDIRTELSSDDDEDASAEDHDPREALWWLLFEME
jgi:hypothetical protein